MKWMLMMWALSNPQFPGPHVSILEYDNIIYETYKDCEDMKHFIIASDPNPTVAFMCIEARDVVK